MSSFVSLSEIENIRLFLQERAQAFDATIETEIGSTFDIEVIQPLINRLGPDPFNTPLRRFILERLAKEFPDLVLQDGEPIDDLVVKPMQILLEPYRRQIQQVSNNQSFANPLALNEVEADNLAGNFFQRRRIGGFAVGVARVFYSAPQFALITPSNPVSTGDGLRFIPVESQAISAENMLFNEEDNLFFFDIFVRAEKQGTEFNIGPNSLVSIDGAPAAVKVTNKQEFEEGDTRESTEVFVERVENSLSEKSLVTTRGINARLLEVFDNVRLIQVVGFGDLEMARDIIKGISETKTFAVFDCTATPLNQIVITPSGDFTDGEGSTDFLNGGVEIGDIVTLVDPVANTLNEFKVKEVITGASLRVVEDTVPVFVGIALLRKAVGALTISDIPGGILEPQTPQGEIIINDDEVHIGGSLDTFIRAGTPQLRDTTIEGARDGKPLHFGIDLESFGEGFKSGVKNSAGDVMVHLTEQLNNQARVPSTDRFGNALATLNQLLIRQFDDSDPVTPFTPWKPTGEDVGRFVQILSPGTRATLKITKVLDEEYIGTTVRAVRIEVADLINLEDGAPYTLASTGSFDTEVRIVEEISVKDRVRDRDGTRLIDGGSPDIPSGSDFVALGAEIGDSVIIETGDDAGIFSIRQILSYLNSNDSIILDRALTKSVTPSGTGNGTGLRYRIADELNVDLVNPKVTKIPLGNIFPGNDLSSVAGSNVVTVSGSTNFLLAGVEVGDTLEILAGDNKGVFRIDALTGTTAALSSSLNNTATSQQFSVFLAFTGVDRPLIRVKSVELLDSNSQPTGVTIPYGREIDGRIKGALANRAEGLTVESFTGAVLSGPDSIEFSDTNVDFVSEGVIPGFRLNVLSTINEGEFTIDGVGVGDGLPNDSTIRVVPVAEGGIAFPSAISPIHYTIGLSSSGFARLFFSEPTTVEISTGLKGGRLQIEEGQVREFRFSDVKGFNILPAAGSDETTPRDLRVVRNKLITFALSVDQDDATIPGGSGVFNDADATFITDNVKASFFLRITRNVVERTYHIRRLQKFHDAQPGLCVIFHAFPHVSRNTHLSFFVQVFRNRIEYAEQNSIERCQIPDSFSDFF